MRWEGSRFGIARPSAKVCLLRTIPAVFPVVHLSLHVCLCNAFFPRARSSRLFANEKTTEDIEAPRMSAREEVEGAGGG